MKLDILAFGVHPDDVELSCSGTLLKHISMGYSCGICDLTLGEMGSRGTVLTRKQEALKSAKILGITERFNLEMKDAFFEINEENIRKIAKIIRMVRPDIVLANAPSDRHPDHGRASKLVSDACFYSGLTKIIITDENNNRLEPWRPKSIFNYIQDRTILPDFVVDITDHIEKKFQSIASFETQFYVDGNQNNDDSIQTPISSKTFIEFLKAKNKVFARDIQSEFAEGFLVERTPGVNDLFNLI
jgi:bacillithiol biosynthesis deacetylase BshB1